MFENVLNKPGLDGVTQPGQQLNQPFGQPKIDYKVNNFLLVPTGRYKPMFIRPYNVNVTEKEIMNLENILSDQDGLGVMKKISPVEIANAVNILQPAEAIKPAEIIGGWEQDRFIFLLTISFFDPYLQSEIILYITGFTDYPNASLKTGNVDEKMMLIPNTVIELVRRTNVNTGVNELVVRGTYSIEYLPDGSVNVNYERGADDGLFLLRPVDAFKVTEYLQEGMDNIPVQSNLKANPNILERKHLLPSEHIADTINTLVTSSMLTADSYDTRDLINTAVATRKTLTSIPFFTELATKFGNNMNFAFPVGYIRQLDPSVQPVIVNPDMSLNNIQIPGILTTTDSADTHIAALEAKLSVLVRDAVSTLIAKHMLLEASFSFTNRTPTGEFVLTPHHAFTVIPGANTAWFFERFKREFLSLVAPTLTMQGNIGVDIHVFASVVGDTRISVSINGGEEVLFRYPTFADSLYNSLITDKNHFLNAAYTYKQIIDVTVLSIDNQAEKNIIY